MRAVLLGLVCPLLMAVLMLAPRPAAASCVGLGCNCTVAADDMSFGSYNPFSASPVDSTTQVRVTCGALILGALISYEVRVGTGGSGSFSTRKLAFGSHRLNYNLYGDAARSSIIGDGSGGTVTISDGYTLSLLFSQTKAYSLYGRIPGSQMVAAGSYSDSIVVTVVY